MTALPSYVHAHKLDNKLNYSTKYELTQEHIISKHFNIHCNQESTRVLPQLSFMYLMSK